MGPAHGYRGHFSSNTYRTNRGRNENEDICCGIIYLGLLFLVLSAVGYGIIFGVGETVLPIGIILCIISFIYLIMFIVLVCVKTKEWRDERKLHSPQNKQSLKKINTISQGCNLKQETKNGGPDSYLTSNTGSTCEPNIVTPEQKTVEIDEIKSSNRINKNPQNLDKFDVSIYYASDIDTVSLHTIHSLCNSSLFSMESRYSSTNTIKINIPDLTTNNKESNDSISTDNFQFDTAGNGVLFEKPNHSDDLSLSSSEDIYSSSMIKVETSGAESEKHNNEVNTFVPNLYDNISEENITHACEEVSSPAPPSYSEFVRYKRKSNSETPEISIYRVEGNTLAESENSSTENKESVLPVYDVTIPS